MSFFLKDIRSNKIISWENLISDLNQTLSYNPYCKDHDYYSVFKQIILSLLLDKEIILLDSDFSESELINLTGLDNYDHLTIQISPNEIQLFANKTELINKLFGSKENWKVTLFTSGTTGVPKKVSHDFKSITRFLKINKHTTDNVWGFAYNPSHMAGIQVFLQALLNGNSIVRLFGLSNDDIYNEISYNKITHISATPTFYRLLLPCDLIFSSVIRITSGGEKFNEQTSNQLKLVFPNAKFTNVYASTELGTLFASSNDIFTVKSENTHLIKIENNELIVHETLLGITDAKNIGWYKTGDVVEIISQNPLQFRFINRSSEMINVGGYKVNPIEVEEALLSFSGIKNARVYSKANSVLGNIICCELVLNNSQLTESMIRTFLQSKIQEFKIPRVFRFVDEISITRTGKLKRV